MRSGRMEVGVEGQRAVTGRWLLDISIRDWRVRVLARTRRLKPNAGPVAVPVLARLWWYGVECPQVRPTLQKKVRAVLSGAHRVDLRIVD